MEKHRIQKILEDNGYECRSYSGRGMFGKKCLGVVMDDFNFIPGLTQDDCDDLNDYMSDNMGLGTIFYWKNIPYVEDYNEETVNDEED
jgi:hypothetical protein